MAAVLAPIPSVRPVGPSPRPAGASGPAGRPQLRLIPGGQSAAARAATFRRRRIVAALLLVTVLVVAVQLAQVAAGWAGGLAGPGSAPIEGPTTVVEARPGDTLWTLARQVHPAGDIRPVVDAMQADRGSTDVQVGDRVRVPLDG